VRVVTLVSQSVVIHMQTFKVKAVVHLLLKFIYSFMSNNFETNIEIKTSLPTNWISQNV